MKNHADFLIYLDNLLKSVKKIMRILIFNDLLFILFLVKIASSKRKRGEKLSKSLLLNEKIAKKLFKNEKYGKQLSAKVISDVIGADYEEVLNNIKPASEEIAFSVLTVNSTADVIYHDDLVYFNIELNFNNIKSKSRQLESYVYQIYLGQLHTYKNYNMIKKIVQISIDGYDYFKKEEFMYKVLLMEEKYHISYNDLIQIIHINIDYLRKIDYNEVVLGSNKLMKDLYFLTSNDDYKLDIIYEKDDIMKDIIDEAKQIAGIEKMDLYLTDEEMMKQDEEYFIKQGLEQGKNQKAIEIAKNLLKQNISIDIIIEATGLTEKQIEELK